MTRIMRIGFLGEGSGGGATYFDCVKKQPELPRRKGERSNGKTGKVKGPIMI